MLLNAPKHANHKPFQQGQPMIMNPSAWAYYNEGLARMSTLCPVRKISHWNRLKNNTTTAERISLFL